MTFIGGIAADLPALDQSCARRALPKWRAGGGPIIAGLMLRLERYPAIGFRPAERVTAVRHR